MWSTPSCLAERQQDQTERSSKEPRGNTRSGASRGAAVAPCTACNPGCEGWGTTERTRCTWPESPLAPSAGVETVAREVGDNMRGMFAPRG
jgi:hypothetical protein